MIVMKKLKLINHKIYTKEDLEIQYIFNNLINETKGVSKEVEAETNSLEDSLYDHFKNNILTKINYNEKEIYVFTDEFETELFNNTITLSIKWILFKDTFTYKCHKNDYEYNYGYNNKNKILYLTVIVIGNNIINTTFSTKLAHEIRHSFQYEKFNIENDGLLHKNSYYTKRNIIPNNEAEEHFKIIIYLSSQREQEAYGEELYNELYKLKPLDYLDVLKNCNSYLAYKSFEKAISYFEENQENKDVKNILKKYNYNFQNFIKKAKKNCYNFLCRLGRAISLYNDEKFEIIGNFENDSVTFNKE